MDSLLQKFALKNEENLKSSTPKSYATRIGRDNESTNLTDENTEE